MSNFTHLLLLGGWSLVSTVILKGTERVLFLMPHRQSFEGFVDNATAWGQTLWRLKDHPVGRTQGTYRPWGAPQLSVTGSTTDWFCGE